MTVCVAAIADRATIIGVSDRMLTAGDIEFEPAQAKIWQFSRAMYAMVSGDSAIQMEILTKVDNIVKKRIATDPKAWVFVKDAALLYCKYYRELRRERAEAAILHPLGLDVPSFLTKQSKMQADLVADIAKRLTEYEFDSAMETLFIGKDMNGPVNLTTGEPLIYAHLYATDKDSLADLSSVGFAAIGIGKFHAESQLMSAGQWPAKPFHETLLLAYAAKKRAEVAPGVGKETDVIVVGPALGESFKSDDSHISRLDKIYQKTRRSAARAVKAALGETKEFIDQVKKEEAQKEKNNNANEKAPIPVGAE